jgi:hypothetical protein
VKLRLMDVILATTLCTEVLAPGLALAQAGASTATLAKPARTVQVTTKAPDPAKWQATTTNNGARRVFKCKPLACLAPETVSFVFDKGSTVTPNPQSLEKFASVDLPRSIRSAVTDPTEQVDNLFSAVTKVKEYPAVLNETRFSRPPKTAYVETAIIFAGPAIIRVESTSPNQKLAKDLLSQFLDVMKIVETDVPAPTSPNAPPTSPKTQSL